ncbi:MAG: TOBE domain-containing protein [Undibacterium sp.]|nr:TOBE domain-containing protein [Undibacterium sp.]
MNILRGVISSIMSQASVTLIDVQVGETALSATLLGSEHGSSQWRIGQSVDCCFNEMEVAIAKNFSGQLSLRNRLSGKVTAIEVGEILTRVHFLMAEFTVTSVITSRSAQQMELAIGDEILGLVKSNEMNLVLLGAYS